MSGTGELRSEPRPGRGIDRRKIERRRYRSALVARGRVPDKRARLLSGRATRRTAGDARARAPARRGRTLIQYSFAQRQPWQRGCVESWHRNNSLVEMKGNERASTGWRSGRDSSAIEILASPFFFYFSACVTRFDLRRKNRWNGCSVNYLWESQNISLCFSFSNITFVCHAYR